MVVAAGEDMSGFSEIEDIGVSLLHSRLALGGYVLKTGVELEEHSEAPFIDPSKFDCPAYPAEIHSEMLGFQKSARIGGLIVMRLAGSLSGALPYYYVGMNVVQLVGGAQKTYPYNISLAKAVVQSGVLKDGEFGPVYVKVLGPQTRGIKGTSANGITTYDAPASKYSFDFSSPDECVPPPRCPGIDVETCPDGWCLAAMNHPIGTVYRMTVTGDVSGSVIQTQDGYYAASSTIATAAVLEGLACPGQTVTIYVKMEGPQNTVWSVKENGAASMDFKYTPYSFSISSQCDLTVFPGFMTECETTTERVASTTTAAPVTTRTEASVTTATRVTPTAAPRPAITTSITTPAPTAAPTLAIATSTTTSIATPAPTAAPTPAIATSTTTSIATPAPTAAPTPASTTSPVTPVPCNESSPSQIDLHFNANVNVSLDREADGPWKISWAKANITGGELDVGTD